MAKNNSTRRTLLGATIAAASVAAAAPALAVDTGRWPAAPSPKPQPRPQPKPAGEDTKLLALCAEHHALGREFVALVKRSDEVRLTGWCAVAAHDAALERNRDRACEIEDALSEMTAYTPAGQAAQMRTAMRTLTADPDGGALDLLDGTEPAWGILEQVLAALNAGVSL